MRRSTGVRVVAVRDSFAHAARLRVPRERLRFTLVFKESPAAWTREIISVVRK